MVYKRRRTKPEGHATVHTPTNVSASSPSSNPRPGIRKINATSMYVAGMFTPDAATVEAVWDRIDLMSGNLQHYDLIVDVRDAEPPNPLVRKVVKGRIQRNPPRRIQFVTGQNRMVTISLGFLRDVMGETAIGAVEEIEEALRALEDG